MAAVMASTQQQATSGSPISSEEVESHHGTPETKMSAFSPEVFHQPKAGTYGAVRSNLPPAFSLNHTHEKSSPKTKLSNLNIFGSQDPFVTNLSFAYNGRGSNNPPKLSPVASSFTPHTFQEMAPVSSRPHGSNVSLLKSNSQVGVLDLNHVAATLVPGTTSANGDSGEPPLILGSEVPAPTASQPEVSVSLNGHTTTEGEFVKMGRFSSDEETSRSLVISEIPQTTSSKDIDGFFSSDTFCSLKHLLLRDLDSIGSIFVNFTDIRDAQKAYAKVQSVHGDWRVQYIAGTNPAIKIQPESLKYAPLSRYAGQVIIKAEFIRPSQRFDPGTIRHLIKELLENYGEIMGFQTSMKNLPIATYRAEFYDTAAADSALTYLNGFRIGGCTLTIMRYSPDLGDFPLQLLKNHGPLIIGQQDTGISKAFGNMNLSLCHDIYNADYLNSPLASPLFFPTSVNQSIGCISEYPNEQSLSSTEDYGSGFTPRSSGPSSPWSPAYSPYSDFGLHSPSWAAFNPGAVGQERSTPQARSGHYLQQQRSLGKSAGRHSHDYSSGHHNVVEVDRIRLGTDVRTTIMLRNIPNKIDQSMLKDIVDETSLGKYDFMYLRIDFANNCKYDNHRRNFKGSGGYQANRSSVGYAFINFEDPIHIIDFVNARAGHRWNRYNSDKVAEVSYATIQGRDCLVQKFRNSSVMLEHPSFRPKIFHTGQGALAGTEDKFPGPDNPSKMRRSVENAEHVGLFAPRAGQNFRDEQRRRRSQYDRGTRLAEIEDAYDYDIDHHEFKSNSNPVYPTSPYGRYRGCPHPGHDRY